MITLYTGDFFDSKCQTLVNAVNCVGVMGSGIALEFKSRFPEMFLDYRKRCVRRNLMPGFPYIYKNDRIAKYVLNFPTKDHWLSDSKLEYIVDGLQYLTTHYQQWGITSIAVPPLGCGRGRLKWSVVEPILHQYLNELSIPVELYEPYGVSKN